MKYVAMVGQTRTVVEEGTTVSGGSAKELTTEELAEHIKAKSPRRISDTAATTCAGAILGHPGGNDAGEAIGGIQYKGAAIYHKTRNKPTVSQGCTVFFSDPDGTGHAKIIAVGNHIGSRPNIYSLDWVTRDFRRWSTRVSLQLD